MVTRKGGNRRGTRQIMRKPAGTRGKVSLRNYLQLLEAGDKVALKAESSIHDGIYYKRFHGRIATVERKRGFCYEVSLVDGKTKKTLIVHPVHLKKIKQ
ncbi:MAG: 50S ribosomal protein L21e [Candidatus Woesearchaeota archaeon]